MTTKAQLADFLHRVCRWIIAQPRKCLLSDYDAVFRYVAVAHLNGKLSVAYNPQTTEIQAVAFHWVDWTERIEAKAENGHQQFEFGKPHKGDALFVGEVIGTREGVSRIYKGLVSKYPHLIQVPIYTFRDGKLVKLSQKHIQRFIYGSEVGYGRL